MSPTTRPTPLRDVVLDVALSRGVWMALITAVVSAGGISLATGNKLTAIAGLLPGALVLLSTFLGAHGVATAGEPKVTPVSDPMTLVAGRLVPLTPPPPISPLADPFRGTVGALESLITPPGTGESPPSTGS